MAENTSNVQDKWAADMGVEGYRIDERVVIQFSHSTEAGKVVGFKRHRVIVAPDSDPENTFTCSRDKLVRETPAADTPAAGDALTEPPMSVLDAKDELVLMAADEIYYLDWRENDDDENTAGWRHPGYFTEVNMAYNFSKLVTLGMMEQRDGTPQTPSYRITDKARQYLKAAKRWQDVAQERAAGDAPDAGALTPIADLPQAVKNRIVEQVNDTIRAAREDAGAAGEARPREGWEMSDEELAALTPLQRLEMQLAFEKREMHDLLDELWEMVRPPDMSKAGDWQYRAEVLRYVSIMRTQRDVALERAKRAAQLALRWDALWIDTEGQAGVVGERGIKLHDETAKLADEITRAAAAERGEEN